MSVVHEASSAGNTDSGLTNEALSTTDALRGRSHEAPPAVNSSASHAHEVSPVINATTGRKRSNTLGSARKHRSSLSLIKLRGSDSTSSELRTMTLNQLIDDCYSLEERSTLRTKLFSIPSACDLFFHKSKKWKYALLEEISDIVLSVFDSLSSPASNNPDKFALRAEILHVLSEDILPSRWSRLTSLCCNCDKNHFNPTDVASSTLTRDKNHFNPTDVASSTLTRDKNHFNPTDVASSTLIRQESVSSASQSGTSFEKHETTKSKSLPNIPQACSPDPQQTSRSIEHDSRVVVNAASINLVTSCGEFKPSVRESTSPIFEKSSQPMCSEPDTRVPVTLHRSDLLCTEIRHTNHTQNPQKTDTPYKQDPCDSTDYNYVLPLTTPSEELPTRRIAHPSMPVEGSKMFSTSSTQCTHPASSLHANNSLPSEGTASRLLCDRVHATPALYGLLNEDDTSDSSTNSTTSPPVKRFKVSDLSSTNSPPCISSPPKRKPLKCANASEELPYRHFVQGFLRRGISSKQLSKLIERYVFGNSSLGLFTTYQLKPSYAEYERTCHEALT